MFDRLTVLCWHSVGEVYSAPWTAEAALRGFGEQLSWLGRYANVVDLEDGLQRLRRGELGPRAVALTFDDGYRDNLEVAAPLLAEHGMTATVFVVTDYLSGTTQPWWEYLAWAIEGSVNHAIEWDGECYSCRPEDRRATYLQLSDLVKLSSHAKRLDQVQQIVDRLQPEGRFPHHQLFLDWTSAGRLIESGLSLGAHTTSHSILARETPEAQLHDLHSCRSQLIERFGLLDPVLAYPNGSRGDYDEETIRSARRAGFSYALRGVDGWNDRKASPLELNRFFVRPDLGARGLARAALRHLRTKARSSCGRSTIHGSDS